MTKHIKILFNIINHIIKYPTPITISYMWSFGALSGIFFSIQLVTGILLGTHYSAGEFAFESVEYIMRDVNNGWLLRYIHANSASFFFICIYIHVGRGIFFKSYLAPRNIVWNSGIIILILSILTAFLGYVLPWGQMSYWGATVISNLVSVTPLIGITLVNWIWGGFTVTEATVIRFYVLHFLFSIILAFFIFVHISFLHSVGSSSSVVFNKSRIDFFNFFSSKDLFSMVLIFNIFFFLVFYHPNILGHPDNYIKANPLSTPAHIVPEWYFLSYYAVLRSVDDKPLGVIGMLLSILSLGLLPFCKEMIKNDKFVFGSNYNLFFYIFVTLFICLGLTGAMPAEYPYVTAGRLLSIMYFSVFIFFFIWCKLKNLIITILSKSSIKSTVLNVSPMIFLKINSSKTLADFQRIADLHNDIMFFLVFFTIFIFFFLIIIVLLYLKKPIDENLSLINKNNSTIHFNVYSIFYILFIGVIVAFGIFIVVAQHLDSVETIKNVPKPLLIEEKLTSDQLIMQKCTKNLRPPLFPNLVNCLKANDTTGQLKDFIIDNWNEKNQFRLCIEFGPWDARESMTCLHNPKFEPVWKTVFSNEKWNQCLDRSESFEEFKDCFCEKRILELFDMVYFHNIMLCMEKSSTLEDINICMSQKIIRFYSVHARFNEENLEFFAQDIKCEETAEGGICKEKNLADEGNICKEKNLADEGNICKEKNLADEGNICKLKDPKDKRTITDKHDFSFYFSDHKALLEALESEKETEFKLLKDKYKQCTK